MSTPAAAGSFSISPIRIELGPDGQPQSIRVRNLDDQSVLVQVEARGWKADLDAAPRADAIVVVPPIATIAAQQEQIVRLAVRRPLVGSVEHAYRLVVTEVPRPTGEARNQLAFALRVVMPVFVTPAGASPHPVWLVTPGADGAAEVAVTNKGTAHLRLHELTVGDSLVVEGTTYVLAGESRSWPLSALPETLEVRAKTNRGPLVAEVRPHAR